MHILLAWGFRRARGSKGVTIQVSERLAAQTANRAEGLAVYYPRFYGMMSGPWRRLRQGTTLLRLVDRLMVGVVAVGYVAVLAWLALAADPRWVRVAIVPAVALVLVTVVRKAVNAPRPYESYHVDPLLPATTQGCSMPSRHVTCATVIACALAWVHLSWGIEMGAAALLVCYTRLAGGLHFPRDVIAGIALGLLCGAIGFLAF